MVCVESIQAPCGIHRSDADATDSRAPMTVQLFETCNDGTCNDSTCGSGTVGFKVPIGLKRDANI